MNEKNSYSKSLTTKTGVTRTKIQTCTKKAKKKTVQSFGMLSAAAIRLSFDRTNSYAFFRVHQNPGLRH